jgi:phage gpG-like protein
MTVTVDIKYNPSYYKKTKTSTYDKALKEAVSKAIQYAESEARKTAPIRTGNLRAHHSTRIDDEKAELVNNCGYASYVAFGTSRQRAQNYPLRIMKDIHEQQIIPGLIKKYLQKKGVV